MGRLIYGASAMVFHFDDRTLAHLQLVIGGKLRRREGFYCSWRDDVDIGGGRSSLWLDAAIPLYFLFDSSSRVPVNRTWLEELTRSANTATGLLLTPEPVEDVTGSLGSSASTSGAIH